MLKGSFSCCSPSVLRNLDKLARIKNSNVHLDCNVQISGEPSQTSLRWIFIKKPFFNICSVHKCCSLKFTCIQQFLFGIHYCAAFPGKRPAVCRISPNIYHNKFLALENAFLSLHTKYLVKIKALKFQLCKEISVSQDRGRLVQ